MLALPICQLTRVIIVGIHYPENLGACARAMKTMGLSRLSLVNPGRLAQPSHEMAFKMAVKSWDVLDSAQRFDSLGEALRGVDLAFSTTARRGQKGVMLPEAAAQLAVRGASRGQHVALVFGNEKTGLNASDVAACQHPVRIPMAAEQPSVNLAQACQILSYEWFKAGLAQRVEESRARTP